MKIGFGYDIHRFSHDRKLVLGGVEIPYQMGLEGHSDADCLTHAISDAILGALGLPDIGHFFPNDDPAIEGIDSQKILARAVEEASKANLQIGNLDCTLVAEKPKMAPYLDAMKATLAATMGITPGQIGIKATTNEGLGAIGAGSGIAAYAVVLLAPAG